MAATATSDVEAGTKITWTRADGAEVPGYAFGEAGKPGAIWLQEWWGVTDDCKRQAAYIASKGFRVLIPDLYRGKLTLDAMEAAHHKEALDFGQAVEDIRGAALLLRSEGAHSVAVGGTCMGGALALLSGLRHPDVISCVSAFYGRPPVDLSAITVPAIGHFGLEDKMAGFSDSGAADALEAELKAAGVDSAVYRYEGVGHAFLNETPTMVELRRKLGMGEPDSDVIRTAWERTIGFFTKHAVTASSA